MTESSKQEKQPTPPQPQAILINPEQLYGMNNDDEIDLRELWNVIWQGKWIIIATTTIFAIAAVIYALSLPNIYKSTATLIPTTGQEQSGTAALAARFGGLASMAGVSLGGSGIDKTKIAIETLKSREFLSEFIKKHNLKPEILAAKSWDAANNRIVYNNEVYNPETKTWAWKTKSQWKNELQPSDQEAVNTLLEKISINMDDKRGVLTIDAFHFSPFVAQQWVQLLVKDINEHVRQEDIADAKRSISYLNIKLEETSISEMRKIFYELIEVQTKTIMLAEVRGEYVLRAIDSALVPELKAKPMRSLISVLGASVGTLIGVFLSILGQSLFKNAR